MSYKIDVKTEIASLGFDFSFFLEVNKYTFSNNPTRTSLREKKQSKILFLLTVGYNLLKCLQE